MSIYNNNKMAGGRGEKMSVTENNFWQDMGGGGGVGGWRGLQDTI